MSKPLIQTLMNNVIEQPLVYISGPYSHPDPIANTRKMIKIADALFRLHVTPLVPHFTLFWHLVRPRSYQFWLEYDLQLLSRADVVLRVPGRSEGADAEIAHARQLRIPVLHPGSGRIQDCVSAVRDWILGRDPASQGGTDESGRD
jgi:hypothetical protein